MHKSQVLFYLLLAFICGVFIASLATISYKVVLMMFILGIAGLAMFGYQRTYSQKGFYGSVLFLIFVLGIWRFSYFDISNNLLIQFADRYAGEKEISLNFRGYIDEEPRINVRTTQFKFYIKEIVLSDRILAVNETTMITANGALFYKMGDTLEVKGAVSRPQNFEDDFDYVNYLKKDGIKTVILFPKISEIGDVKMGFWEERVLDFRKSAFAARTYFEESINHSVGEPNASYINGILLGSRQNIPDDLKEAFNKTGTTHILAISGYNIMLISWAVLMGLIFFFKRRAAFWISVGVIIIFVVLTGASASVVRAAIMGLILSFAHGYGRLYDQKNSIILAGGIMVFHSPFTLVFDIGFQLSFAAVLGLIYLYPRIDNKLNKIPKFGGLKEIFLMTLSAQIAVAPLLIYYFGGFSPLSLPTNVLILPFVPAAMFFGFLAGIGGMLFAPLGQIIGYAAWAVTTYQIEVVKFFAVLF